MDPEEIIERLHPVSRALLIAIADSHCVPATLVVTHCRSKPIAAARDEWWATCYGRLPHWSYPYIGSMTGHDHTSVMSGRRRHLMRVIKGAPSVDLAKVDAAIAAEKCA